MSRVWRRVDLAGTRNDINTTFTIPNYNPAERSWIIFNGRILYETNLPPETTEQFRPVGGTVELGLAPKATDDLWGIFAYETTVVTISASMDAWVATAPAGAAQVYIQDIRKTFFCQVYVYDKGGNLLEVVEEDIKSINWTYSPVGGCMSATIILRRPFDQYGSIGMEYPIYIWRDIDQLGTAGARLPAQFGQYGIQLGTGHVGERQCRWSGFIREIEPVMEENDEYIVLSCNGWARQLEQIVVDNPVPYINRDVGTIVRDIIDNWVIPGSQIHRTPAFNFVPDTGVVINSIQFFATAGDAIRTLAEIAGDCEWGVRADLEFFFIQRNQVVRQTHVIGDRVSLYRPLFSADDTVNRIYIQGSGIKAAVNLSAFEAGFQKERVIAVGALSTPETVALWATGYGSKFAPGLAKPSGRMELVATDDWIEAVGHPTGLLRVIGGPVFVAGGDRLQAQLPVKLASVYGSYTDESFRINQINYEPQDDSLKISIDLGARGNSLFDRMKSIEYKLSELRQSQV